MTGTAYLYADEEDFTARMWGEVQAFIQAKKDRGVKNNLELHKLETNVGAELMRIIFERCDIKDRHGEDSDEYAHALAVEKKVPLTD